MNRPRSRTVPDLACPTAAIRLDGHVPVVGTIREIWRYPVKSMAGQRLDRCTVGPAGIPGDRGWALRDDDAGEIRGARKMPVLMQCAARYRSEPAGS